MNIKEGKLLILEQIQIEEFEGNFGDISKCRKFEDLPLKAQKYINRIEELTDTPVKFIGVGAGREEIIAR